MPQLDWLILMGMGGLFILLGVGAIMWGRIEETSYYNAISRRPDVREFLEHWPIRPQPGALKIGGWIAITVGVVLLIMGIVYWLKG